MRLYSATLIGFRLASLVSSSGVSVESYGGHAHLVAQLHKELRVLFRQSTRGEVEQALTRIAALAEEALGGKKTVRAEFMKNGFPIDVLKVHIEELRIRRKNGIQGILEAIRATAEDVLIPENMDVFYTWAGGDIGPYMKPNSMISLLGRTGHRFDACLGVTKYSSQSMTSH